MALPAMPLYLLALRGIQFAEQLAGRGALQAAVQHQIADAHGIRGHHVHAQSAGELPRKHLRARRAVNQMVFGGQPGQDGRHQIGARLLVRAGLRAKLAFDERLNPRLIHQLELEAVRAQARHFFEPASRLSRNGDQRHVTSP